MDTMKADRGFKGPYPVAGGHSHGANGWHPHTHELWFLKARRKALQKPFGGAFKSKHARRQG